MIVIIACTDSYEERYDGAIVIPDDVSLESLLEKFLNENPGERRSHEFASWLYKAFPAVSQGVRELFYNCEGLTMYSYEPVSVLPGHEWNSKFFDHRFNLREYEEAQNVSGTK